MASVKVQFVCLPIGQNHITCRSTKHHACSLHSLVRGQPVNNETIIDQSTMKPEVTRELCAFADRFASRSEEDINLLLRDKDAIPGELLRL